MRDLEPHDRSQTMAALSQLGQRPQRRGNRMISVAVGPSGPPLFRSLATSTNLEGARTEVWNRQRSKGQIDWILYPLTSQRDVH